MAHEPLIEFRDVALGYGTKAILSGVTATIHRGDFWGIVGPNGSGKTTFLKSILGSLAPRAGTVIRGNAVRFGYVPQRNTIDPLYPLTATDIVTMGLYGLRTPGLPLKSNDRTLAREAIRLVGLDAKHDGLFSELSGGQQQRILLARALVGKPDLLVLDEPTNGMDIVSEASIMKTIEGIHQQTGMTIVLVTHLLHVVAQHVKSIGLIQGDRIEFGSVNDLLTAKHLTQLYGTEIQVNKVGGKILVSTP